MVASAAGAVVSTVIPVRVIDPPTYPDTNPDPDVRQKCQWQMFKDPTKVPEEYYTRVGRTKPSAFGSKALGAPPR